MLERDLEDHPYFKIFKNVGDVASPEDALALQNEVKGNIQNVLNPTYQELYDFLINEYLPESRDTIGISDVRTVKNGMSIWLDTIQPQILPRTKYMRLV